MRARLLVATLTLAAVAAAGLAIPPVAGALPVPADAEQAEQSSTAFAPREDATTPRPTSRPATASPRCTPTSCGRRATPAMDVPTPVILTVSPYTNHNGSTTDVDPTGTGPNPRFYDFLDLTGALTKGYTYVMVDLPGFGGSGGCNDWGGRASRAPSAPRSSGPPRSRGRTARSRCSASPTTAGPA